ncbi:MAG: hypothetical protein HYR85_13825 [Planctomycetes bacterium]|nr:hypothetical protein [Planctomycetota bacterium]MBI3843563.1 hypothetical protein [Planctomycetota bacterium]
MLVRSVSRSVLVAAGVALFAACATTMKKDQLEKVAKDWCLVVRASQVIPVYPLTEDLEPGDVLLVRTPVATQQLAYIEKGFLPLDEFIARLRPLGYKDFYAGGYGGVDDDKSRPPRLWQFPPEGSKVGWDAAPRAAFPSYSFSVQSGAGLSLALPVQGVPVALSLLGAQSADGSITISDAYTYGLDEVALRAKLDEWIKGHSSLIAGLAPNTPGEVVYLRVISRVYLTKSVDVVVNASSTFGGTASAGESKTVDLLDAHQADAYQKTLAALSQQISASLPGGTVKVASASRRSVSLVETFARPLVIGYVGFDLPIESGGRVGPSAPTQSILTNTAYVKGTRFGEDPNSDRIERWIAIAGNRDKLAQWLASRGIDRTDIPNVISGAEHSALRAEIVTQLQIP